MRIIKFPGLRFGHTIYCYLELNSTQDKAKELSRTGVRYPMRVLSNRIRVGYGHNKLESDSDINQGVVVCARTQTKGRGRKADKWVSEPGGLYFSIIYKSVEPIVQVSDFTRKLALYVKDAIEKVVLPVFPINLEVRGINDIYLNNKKLAGIIVETESYGLSQSSERNNYIIGIGVNVNQPIFSGEIQKTATSLLIETNQRFSRLYIMKAICEQLSVNLYNTSQKNH